jgi:hypothetical protein
MSVSSKNAGVGGGVMAYVRSDTEAAWTAEAGEDFELGILDFATKGQGIRIVILYRRPGENATPALLDELTDAMSTRKRVIVTGDINLDTLNATPTPRDLHLHLCAIAGTQLVQQATRPASGKCMDHFWVNEATDTEVLVLDNSSTDHLPIKLSLRKSIPETSKRQKPMKLNWKAVPIDTIGNLIKCYDWSALFLATTLILAMAEWNKFVTELTSLPPVTSSKPKPNEKISPELRALMTERDDARKTSGSSSRVYKDLRNRVV